MSHPTWSISNSCSEQPQQAAKDDEWTCPACGQKWICWRKSLPRRDRRNGEVLHARPAAWQKDNRTGVEILGDLLDLG